MTNLRPSPPGAPSKAPQAQSLHPILHNLIARLPRPVNAAFTHEKPPFLGRGQTRISPPCSGQLLVRLHQEDIVPTHSTGSALSRLELLHRRITSHESTFRIVLPARGT